MFFRSIREFICLALLDRLKACCERLFPIADQNEPKSLIELERRAHDLSRAADAAAKAGDWQIVPDLEARREEVDKELKEAHGAWAADKEKNEIGSHIGVPSHQGNPRPRLFATQAKLNFAFAMLYMRRAAVQER